jgi:hypothetical protein
VLSKSAWDDRDVRADEVRRCHDSQIHLITIENRVAAGSATTFPAEQTMEQCNARSQQWYANGIHGLTFWNVPKHVLATSDSSDREYLTRDFSKIVRF